MVMSKIYCRSIDEVLSWLRIGYNPSLPDPNDVENSIITIPVYKGHITIGENDNIFTSDVGVEMKNYKKLVLYGQHEALTVWEEM